ncbi:Flp pilus assembly protein, ATPase CpaE [Desulfosporosinus acidiphilus SJ4]|uniref:Flp pilus assembly protein, ATPase CpaE n=1 Tax=Desulfosporosinus acidiphilus (strain DSM 22704 / JCM 16185 / SJ4) TaxID=646529 RepID=I4DAY5_DESAJ|nr:Flp pilus assembly protein, ATPase CpaE [Desulfosporosinus acidiphilus]AFM42959.1 Flp pilus assembly protein, ATPase CpaE [Desulfosporosinus acidiphilus SJ4]
MIEFRIALAISNDELRKKLDNYLRFEFDIPTVPLKTLDGAEAVDASLYIIARNDIADSEWDKVVLLGKTAKVAVLYGSRSVPVSERFEGVRPLTGALPGCIRDWMNQENILTSDAQGDMLEWDDSGNDANPSASGKGKNRRIGIWSPGGGVGKTTGVVHLAKLAEQDRWNVGIVETDEDKGGVLRYLGKMPAKIGLDSMAKQLWEDPHLFAQEMEKIVQTVGRIQVVPMTGTVDGLTCDDKSVDTLHEWTESRFALTLYDLPPRLRDVMTFSVLNEVDDVIVVVEPTDVLMDAMDKHLRLCREIQKMQDLPQKYKLIVNKVPENHGLNPQEMADSLGIPLLGVVPAEIEHYDRIINKGRFVIPNDSPWRTIYQNLNLGGMDNPSPVLMAKRPIQKNKRGWLQRLLG